MANMSYCAFENTESDLRQLIGILQEALNEGMTLQEFIDSRSSTDEKRAVVRIQVTLYDLQELFSDFVEE